MALAVITDYNSKLFVLNGIKYVRNFIATRRGNTVTIRNAYDTRFALVTAHYTEYEINGNVFTDAPTLIGVLSPLIFVKDEITNPENGEAGNNLTNAVFYNSFGQWVNTPTLPATGAINIDLTGAVNGGLCAVYLKAATLNITGGTIVIQSGTFIANELCLIWIVYDKGSNGFHVNIQTGFTGNLPGAPPGDTIPPEIMTITNVVDTGGTPPGDTTPPATMVITDVTDTGGADTTAPATMTITTVT